MLVLIADGLTNAEIGQRLFVSPATVKAHVESLLRKTGTTGRAQLAAQAAADGLIARPRN